MKHVAALVTTAFPLQTVIIQNKFMANKLHILRVENTPTCFGF